VDHIDIISRDPLFAAGLHAYTVHAAVKSRVIDVESGEVISDWSLGKVIGSMIVGLPQFENQSQPQNTHSVDLTKQITILRDSGGLASFTSGVEGKLRNAVEHLLSQKCDDAFHNAGLASPADIIFKTGVTVGPASLLLNPDNARSIGITESARARDVGSVGSTAIQAITIRDHAGYAPDTTDGRARIFLNASAFGGGVLSLQEVLAHEFIHVANIEGRPPGFFGTLLGHDDLSYYKYYDSILKACR